MAPPSSMSSSCELMSFKSPEDVDTFGLHFFSMKDVYCPITEKTICAFIGIVLRCTVRHPEQESMLVQAVDHFLKFRLHLNDGCFSKSVLEKYVRYLKDRDAERNKFLEEPNNFVDAKQNNFAVSFGLVVKTTQSKVVVLKRNLPYCVQNFLHKSRKKKGFRFNQIQFEKEIYPTLNISDRIDYDNFLANHEFEDRLDFPHGQMQRKDRVSQVNPEEYVRVAFANAFKEFVEETDLTFSYDAQDIPTFPLRRVDFTGLDGCRYTQFYFIVSGVKRLRRACKYSFKQTESEDKVIYTAQLINENTVFNSLQRQQKFKKDDKHLLLKHEELPEVTLEELVEKIMTR